MTTALATPPQNVSNTEAPRTASPAPLAYNLQDLQLDAANRFGLTHHATLMAADALYHRHLITYPRTDIRHLVENMFEEYRDLAQQHKKVFPACGCDTLIKGPVWNTRKVGDHHGIMPTLISAAAVFGLSWSEAEMQVYGLIHERFLALFRPH